MKRLLTTILLLVSIAGLPAQDLSRQSAAGATAELDVAKRLEGFDDYMAKVL